VTLAWIAGACVIAVASFVMGLTGFGVALVSMAFLPYLMSPVTAIVLLTIYALVLSVAIVVQLRRDVRPLTLIDLLVGSVIGTPLGVWGLAALPVSTLNRLIGLTLLVAVGLEWRRLYPAGLEGRLWGLGAGVLAGVIGGAVGTPGPPVILYGASQKWSPRTMKANISAFFIVNQGVILAGYWWTGLLTVEVGRLALFYAAPAVVGYFGGVALFDRLDVGRFRRLVFALLLVSGLVLLIRG
jgi:uncharacterized membrane protein YfcA